MRRYSTTRQDKLFWNRLDRLGVLRSATEVWMSGLDCLHVKSILTTLWGSKLALFSGINYGFSFTLNKCELAGVVAIPFASNGRYSNILFIHDPFLTLKHPVLEKPNYIPEQSFTAMYSKR
jgi:hypothetical protein